MSKIDEIRARYSDNGLSVDEYNKLTVQEIAQMRVDVKRTLKELGRVEAENADLKERLKKAEFYEKCIGERYAEYHKINIGQEQEIFKLEKKLAAVEKERDAYKRAKDY